MEEEEKDETDRHQHFLAPVDLTARKVAAGKMTLSPWRRRNPSHRATRTLVKISVTFQTPD